MSSRFVSATSKENPSDGEDGWMKAQQAVERTLKPRQEEGMQEGGKSLYEVLQQNKTAKQEAFEESLRLKSQFRTLDEDEIDFLDSVMESTRAKEEQVKRETAEQLDAFRKQREAVEREISERNAAVHANNSEAGSLAGEDSWATSSRKRRRRARERDDEGKAKLRKVQSSTADAPPMKLSRDSETAHPVNASRAKVQAASTNKNEDSTGTANQAPDQIPSPRTSVPSPHISLPALGLAAYSSDED